jgi:tryptophan synthase alpha chain
VIPLAPSLAAAKAGGRKLLIPYVTGGITDNWVEFLLAIADAGADAVEIGIPFSDPVMDGPTIQAASLRALERGTTPADILAALREVESAVPLVAMTYGNIAHKAGWRRFADDLVHAGVGGAIVPDLPLEESAPWEVAATSAGVATVLLAAPVSPDDRLDEICRRSRGFVYGVTVMGVTGARTTLPPSAVELAKRLGDRTDLPVCMGFGVSTPDQAAELAAVADGVVVASALMRQVLDGAAVGEVAAAVGAMRKALD